MASKFRQSVNSSQTHFTSAPMGEIEFSRMTAKPQTITDFSAGDIVPVYCAEVLPHDTFDISIDFDIRQATIATPTMGRMMVDYYAFFVPNRIVNHSWKNVQGENTSGAWVAPEVSLIPLVDSNTASVQIPVCSVADYYGFPTQRPISGAVLRQCHDLKFRGYLEIYNNYFRDQNYQPPIPYSKLNIFNGFFAQANTFVSIDADGSNTIRAGQLADGTPFGSIQKAIGGDGSVAQSGHIIQRKTSWSALAKPLKANKLHDYFTSVLPSPQKGKQVVISLGDRAQLDTGNIYAFENNSVPLYLNRKEPLGSDENINLMGSRINGVFYKAAAIPTTSNVPIGSENDIVGTNLYADIKGLSLSVEEMRMSSAIQQLYEILGRSGSRYVEFVNSFFGLSVENPFDDIPTQLGHIRRELDLYQTAQTSASSPDGESSPQGNLAAFGYTSNGGHLFTKTFVEHGYIHIFAVVRHKNVYSSMLSRDNFRLNMLDFYTYPLANITEQPVYTREINPFGSPDGVFGYQEAWAEYRMEPDRVTGHMRSGLGAQSLDFWNYADDFDATLEIADADFLRSNSAEVLSRTTALSETNAPQFKAQMFFTVTKQRPMPTYSVAGLDII